MRYSLIKASEDSSVNEQWHYASFLMRCLRLQPEATHEDAERTPSNDPKSRTPEAPKLKK